MDQRAFWLRPTSYWLPVHFPVSAWNTHAPFAAWLIDVLRPASVVELGTHMGFSCFAFAEAAARLGHPMVISALDSWQGDDHAGFYGEDVLEGVRAIAERDYPDSVRLVRGWFSESRPIFEDASVDLLHIDGRHGYEDSVEDYEEWRSVVRDGGLILFHDIAERERGFGVWRLWNQLQRVNPSFTFHHGHGLGVLAVGEVRTDALRKLFDADETTAERIRSDFERLGAEAEERSQAASLAEQLRQSRLHATQLEGELERRIQIAEALRGVIGERDRQIHDLESSTSWRVTAPLRAVGRALPHRD
ncbi:class I SAM-dependent methyltransferase [Microbacterium trichothecenolyticum]|uniref:class I SAM-dependent methyltransferase n=1 Tax=Microbacterium trichothecenolyticum TaxID=69370 RepID=UPI0035BE448F